MTTSKTDPVSSGNIYQRLNRVMLAIEYIQKEKKSGMNYSIVSHDAVTAAVRPKMVGHGVIYYPLAMTLNQNGNRTEVTMTVRFQNVDDPSDHMDVVSAGFGIDPQDKGPGKAISYAVKYALLKALGLESGDDPDNDQNVTLQTKQQIDAAARYALLSTEIETMDMAELAVADKMIRSDYGAGAIDKPTTQALITKIKKRHNDLSKEPADA